MKYVCCKTIYTYNIDIVEVQTADGGVRGSQLLRQQKSTDNSFYCLCTYEETEGNALGNFSLLPFEYSRLLI